LLRRPNLISDYGLYVFIISTHKSKLRILPHMSHNILIQITKRGKVSLSYPFLLFVSNMQSMKVDTQPTPSLLS